MSGFPSRHPPRRRLAGAEILLNLSASNIVIGKAEARRLLCASQSARCIAAYAYSAAGAGESTTDLAWDGQAAIFEYGRCLAETDRFPTAPDMAVADVDLALLRQERMRVGTFSDCVGRIANGLQNFARFPSTLDAPEGELQLLRAVDRFPYVPSDPIRLKETATRPTTFRCKGLTKRLQATQTRKVVIGVSGGLDSTQALIVCDAGDGSAWAASLQRACLHACRALPRRTAPKPTPGADARARRFRSGNRHPAGRAPDAC